VRAHTNIQIKESPKTLKEKGQVEAAAYGPPFSVYLYETPASIACVYDLLPGESVCNPNVVVTNPKGGSRAIAIVDAFDDPNAYANLATYSAQFGLAAINPESIIMLGLLILIATPVARVALAAVGFALERDRLYTVVSLIVLVILVFSLIHAT